MLLRRCPQKKKTGQSSVAAVPVQQAASPPRHVASFADMVALVAECREPLLASQLKQFASLVSFAPGRVEVFMKTAVPRDFFARVTQTLTRATGTEWKIALAGVPGEPTLEEQETVRRAQEISQANEQPLVAKLREQFPGAEVVAVVGG